MFPCGQTLQLGENDSLWRRFMADEDVLTWDRELGWLPNPRSNALQMNPDLSMAWREHLIRHGFGPAIVLVADDRYSLVGEVAIRDVKRLTFGVSHSPKGSTQPECSHSSVDWPTDSVRPPATEPSQSVRKALRYNLSREFRFIFGTLPPPPEGAPR